MTALRTFVAILSTDRMFPGNAHVDPDEPCSRCGQSTVDYEENPLLLFRANGDMWRFCWTCLHHLQGDPHA